MPELGTVLDAPEVTDVAAEDVIAAEPVEGQDTAAEADKPVEEVKGDERVMPQWIKNLKATDPLGFKAAKADFFGKRALDEKLKDFDLDGTKGWLEEHGGRDAIVSTITELQGKAAEFDDIMGNLEKGVLPELAPETISKVAPIVAQQWKDADPEGWGQSMSGIMAATIQQNGIPLHLERMAMCLEFGKTEQLGPMLQQLKEWAGGFQAAASAPRTMPLASPKGDGKPSVKDERAAWEAEKFEKEITADIEGFRTPLIAQELKSFISRRPNEPDLVRLATKDVKDQVVARMKDDADYQGKFNTLWNRKDKAGAMKLLKSRETAAIQEIAPKVGRTIFGNPSGAQPVDKKPSGTPSKADVGWAFTDKPPAPQLVDKFRTTDAMIMRGKFILKDGSKVTLEA